LFQEKELEKQREEKLAKDNLNASFVLDRETGMSITVKSGDL